MVRCTMPGPSGSAKHASGRRSTCKRFTPRQGQLVRRLIRRQVKRDVAGSGRQRLLGFGYALPYLGPLAEAAERLCVHAGAAGGVRWPPDRPNAGRCWRAEDELPLADRAIDRVLLVHALEMPSSAAAAARGLARARRRRQALCVVPNRRGLWCLSDTTPFGHGQPFSAAQLSRRCAATSSPPGAGRPCSCRRAGRGWCCAPPWSGNGSGCAGQRPSRACC